MPEILNRISERTGLQFTYIRGGEEDRRLRLAKNGQVEMASGYAPDSQEMREYGLKESSPIFTIHQNGQEIRVCFAFTDIAGTDLKSRVESALNKISNQELAEISATFAMEHQTAAYPKWLPAAGAGALVLLARILIALLLHLRSYKKSIGHNEWYDVMTSIGNKAYFAEHFEKFIPDSYGGLYCVVFIGFDIARVNQYYGEAETEEQLCFAAKELVLSVSDNEIAARVSGGGFAVARPSSNEQEAEEWVKKLLPRLNRYTEKYGKDYRPDFYAGIYMLHPSDRDCETVLFNARQGYQLAINSDTPYVFSRREHLSSESEKLQLKKQTMEAIQKREFQMFLQFIVHGESGEIVSAEALSRWDHPQKGLLHPGKYIELMESEKTIAELDFYLFEEVCRQLEQWQKQGRQMNLSCNFARITIDNENFISQIQGIALLKGMIALGHSLQMEVLCEGVETAGEVELLRELNCDYMQGYYFYRALPQKEAERVLKERMK